MNSHQAMSTCTAPRFTTPKISMVIFVQKSAFAFIFCKKKIQKLNQIHVSFIQNPLYTFPARLAQSGSSEDCLSSHIFFAGGFALEKNQCFQYRLGSSILFYILVTNR